MARRRKRPKVSDVAIEAALAGEEPIELESFLELIRGINPSRLALSKEERQRRYALKGRLQSELIRRFGAELELVPAGAGAFGIRLRGARGDACHARLDRLEEDVRSVAQRALARCPRDRR